ncbi:hypothetical protein [Malikia spinosa]|uniref:hypothetical protein n=1 Tax=Malikia spinosa TaxID=86180 RepID=UPI0011B0D8F9|nr:hypothetical protein [Malikia spinosa]
MKPKKVIAWRRRAAAAEALAREAQLTARSVEFQKVVAEALLRELHGLRFEVEVLRDDLRHRTMIGGMVFPITSAGATRPADDGVSQ